MSGQILTSKDISDLIGWHNNYKPKFNKIPINEAEEKILRNMVGLMRMCM